MESATTHGARERLWSALLALGFSPSGEAGKPLRGSVWKSTSRAVFSKNMFDKPNMDAFQTVAHYLFVMLDQTRSNSLFRDCWPIYDKKMTADFRKVCFEWLKKIADEVGSTFPQVVASLFLSPGGPKFINLMYHFAKYVLLKKYNEKAAKKSTWLPIEMGGKHQNLHLATMKSCIASNRFLEGIQKEAFIVAEYQKREELLVKENQILRKPCTEQKHCLEKSSCGNAEEQIIQKQKELQEMWNVVMDTLSQLEREMEAIDSILNGNANRYTLDGTNVAIKVPSQLFLRTEGEMHQIGNLYEAGKLSMRTIIQLCNSSLKLCEKKYRQIGTVKLGTHHDYLKRVTKFLKCELSKMEDKSQKITEIVVPSIKISITKMENAWDKKWEQYLSRTGFSPVKKKYPVLDLLPVMSAWSFEAASEEVYKNSVFSYYPALLPVSPEKTSARDSKKDEHYTKSCSRRFNQQNSLKSLFPRRLSKCPIEPTIEVHSQCLMENITEVPVTSPQLDGRESLIPCLKKMEIEQKDETPQITCWKETKDTCKKRDDMFQKASDQLAEEVANAIAYDSPQPSETKGMALDKIFEFVLRDPFVTRTELPRTPEDLITDIKTSWRYAVQETESEQGKLLNEMPSSPTTHGFCGKITSLLPEDSPTATLVNVSDWPINHGNISLISAANMETPQCWFASPDRKIVPSVKVSSNCLLDQSTSSSEKGLISLGYLFPKANRNTDLFPKADVECRSEAVGSLDNSKGSKICCSDFGSDCRFDSSSFDSMYNHADHELSREPTISFKPQLSDSGDDYVSILLKNNLASSLTSATEANPDQCFPILNLAKLSLKSPIKKEKLSKSVAVEIYKKFAAFENSGSSSSLGTESDLQDTLPWNESPRFFCEGEDGGILQETIPDEHGNECWNSPIDVNTDQVNTSGAFKSDLRVLQSRYNQLRKTCFGISTIYGANQEQYLTENTEAVQFDSKDECESGLVDVHYFDNFETIDKRESVDKRFFLDQNFLRTPSPVSSEHQIPSLGLIQLNDSLPDDEFYKIQLSEKKEPQRTCASDCEKSVYQDTLPDGVEQLINF